ncbi:sterile alpha motif domain-containing protein 5-like [Carcharodon carcharias]|uniref:sterile alpha motif domain-containing protein 5-like n=1 Tax=Carcharodon carcharias TaxID=13397 RepID=UPI001B7F420A|nr:sterile alpha motif domain-containing protein 5-like [Carcharodon carcharias]
MLFEEGEMSIGDWLSVIHLEQYTDHFVDNRYRRVSDCWGIRNEDLSRIGVFLPGHRKRILSALNKARQETLTPDPPYQPALTPDPSPEPPEKPVPKKRNVYLCSQISDPALQTPSAKPLPPIPPRQSPGRPPERLTPWPCPARRASGIFLCFHRARMRPR